MNVEKEIASFQIFPLSRIRVIQVIILDGNEFIYFIYI